MAGHDSLDAGHAEPVAIRSGDRDPAPDIQLPFSYLSVNCDSYKVAIIWAIITTEFEGSLNRKLSS